MESNDVSQLKTDLIRIEVEFERLERKVDGLQNDVTALRWDFDSFRNETRSNFQSIRSEMQSIRSEFKTEMETVKEDVQSLRAEMRAGFDNLERIVLRVLDRRRHNNWCSSSLVADWIPATGLKPYAHSNTVQLEKKAGTITFVVSALALKRLLRTWAYQQAYWRTPWI